MEDPQGDHPPHLATAQERKKSPEQQILTALTMRPATHSRVAGRDSTHSESDTHLEEETVDLSKRMRLASGPLQLPKVIASNAKTIRLFMAYLQQGATREAIVRAAAQKHSPRRETNADKAFAAIYRLGTDVPHDHEALCRLVAKAPDLMMVWGWAWAVTDEDILPASALIPREVIDACVETYHKWVAQRSRQRD